MRPTASAKPRFDRIGQDTGRELKPHGNAVVTLWPSFVLTERLLAFDAEAVLQRVPALIVGGSDAPDMQVEWQRFASMPAVKNQAFVRLDADRLHRPAPRLIEGVAALCAALAPYQR